MIHQKKGNIFLCLVLDVILRIDINVKKIRQKRIFLLLFFSNVHISVNNEYENLKDCVHVGNIRGEGTVSQIFSFCPSFYFM